MKVSYVRGIVATAALVFTLLVGHAQAATLAFEAFYDPGSGNLSISPYDSDTGTPWVGNAELALVDFNSLSGAFTGDPPNNPAGAFPSDSNTRVSWALLGSSVTVSVAAPYDLGNVAQAGLTQAFIDTDFQSAAAQGSVLGEFSWGDGNSNVGSGPVTALAPVPEPSTIASLGFGAAAILGYTGRRRLRRGRGRKAT